MSCEIPYVSEPAPAVQSLRYGDSRTAVAQVIAADDIPSLWRVILADGRLTSPMNLTHAKDGAMAVAERGPPPRNSQRLHWHQDRSESPSAPRGRVRASAPATTQLGGRAR